MNQESTASFLDKTDWRVTLHRKLEACVDAEGNDFYYPKRVKSLISAAAAQYPGWDAEEEINKYVTQRKKITLILWDTWLDDNLTKRRWQKYNYKRQLGLIECKDIFTFIKNMCARKRMLLWGSKETKSGKEMKDEPGA